MYSGPYVHAHWVFEWLWGYLLVLTDGSSSSAPHQRRKGPSPCVCVYMWVCVFCSNLYRHPPKWPYYWTVSFSYSVQPLSIRWVHGIAYELHVDVVQASLINKLWPTALPFVLHVRTHIAMHKAMQRSGHTCTCRRSTRQVHRDGQTIKEIDR